MSIFTSDEKFTLSRHKILPENVFDGRGMPSSRWKVLAKAEEKSFVLAEVCGCGSRLRDRANHCIECHPATVGFQRRSSEKGQVYIAASKRGKLYKVGSSSDAVHRGAKLCSDVYGGHDDWEIIAWAKVEAMGRVEFEVHKKLLNFATTRTYQKEGKACEAGELFDTSLLKVWRAFFEVTAAVPKDNRWRHKGFAHFEFDKSL